MKSKLIAMVLAAAVSVGIVRAGACYPTFSAHWTTDVSVVRYGVAFKATFRSGCTLGCGTLIPADDCDWECWYVFYKWNGSVWSPIDSSVGDEVADYPLECEKNGPHYAGGLTNCEYEVGWGGPGTFMFQHFLWGSSNGTNASGNDETDVLVVN